MTAFVDNAGAIAALDALLDTVDSGGAGTLQIWEGTVPADADTSITDGVGGYNLLAELTMSATAFGGATDGTGKATAAAASITDDNSANKTGTAQFFRVISGGGNVVLQGSVGTSGADLNLNTTSIVSGGVVSVSSLTVELPEQGS